MRLTFLWTVIFLGSAVAAQAEVKFDLKYSGYDVRGLTISEIHSAIDQRLETGAGELLDGKEIVEGAAHDEINWTLDLKQAEGSCRVRSNEVAIRVEIVLPTWIDETRATEEVRSNWNSYFTQLKAHEEQHKDIALQTAERLDALLKAAQREGPCDPFRQELNNQAKQVLAEEEAE